MNGTPELTSGLMVIHGDRPEALRDLIVAWMRRYPLAPLESETILVQSNGIAQWLKLALAADEEDGGCGVAASLSVQLPARFLWQAYRGVLGREAVPEVSAFDETALVWRLMRLLPGLIVRDEFSSLRRYLANDADLRKRYQLALRLADLIDQYQVYRADWLDDWANGRDCLRHGTGVVRDLMTADRWQAHLWRALIADIGRDALAGSRAGVHGRFIEHLAHTDTHPSGLPRRVVVFGISAMPAQMVEALAAIARVSQVLMCVHNPCRHHWADIVADKDLLRHEFRRHARRPGMPPLLDADAQHQHAHPLLAAWGKQGRDYINLLDRYDAPERYRGLFGAVSDGRIDLFSDEQPGTLLAQLQNDILELRPLAETREIWPAVDAANDTSIRFHIAHSPQREVEILHDQLLARFDATPNLRAREVIVMVPDINAYAPHIEAVFGQIAHQDKRFIPYTIADSSQRGRDPLLVALESLLRLPESRFAVSEVLDLLDVAAVRACFGLNEADLPLLRRWIDGAGVRWGLSGTQREGIGLPAADGINTWRFGWRRMLVGFAVGEGDAFEGIEPFAEIGGLDAAVLGPLTRLIEELERYGTLLAVEARPLEWAQRLRALFDAFFAVTDEHDDMLRLTLFDLLDEWLAQCAEAAFDDPLPVTVVREAWLAGLDAGGLQQRFLAGAVSFCTLMPMRAIPFRVVCLLGMNDGDYPRAYEPPDFDLMRNDYRPGDRSRREDDRYLLLEALLSAREQLYVSWVGRSIRDNTSRPPSVLIGQLRDHLAAGWNLSGGDDLLAALTCEHPLQPFSRRYFESAAKGIDGLYTYAHEWRDVLRDASVIGDASLILAPMDADMRVDLDLLAEFLAQPVDAFFKRRLRVRFGNDALIDCDEEVFSVDALTAWQLHRDVCERLRPWVEQEWTAENLSARLDEQFARLRGEGRLPSAQFGQLWMRGERAPLVDLLTSYRQQVEAWPETLAASHELAYRHGEISLSAWIGGLRSNGEVRADLRLISGRLHSGKDIKWHSLVRPWVRHLGLQLVGTMCETILVSQSGTLRFRPMDAAQAGEIVNTLIDAWREGMCRPLPVACRTALAFVQEGGGDTGLQKARAAYEGGYSQDGEVARYGALARAYPDFDTLISDGEFEHWAHTLYGPLIEHARAASGGGEEGGA